MWTYKMFKTYNDMALWISKNEHKYLIEQVFVDKGFCVEYKPLVVIDIK